MTCKSPQVFLQGLIVIPRLLYRCVPVSLNINVVAELCSFVQDLKICVYVEGRWGFLHLMLVLALVACCSSNEHTLTGGDRSPLWLVSRSCTPLLVRGEFVISQLPCVFLLLLQINWSLPSTLHIPVSVFFFFPPSFSPSLELCHYSSPETWFMKENWLGHSAALAIAPWRKAVDCVAGFVLLRQATTLIHPDLLFLRIE